MSEIVPRAPFIPDQPPTVIYRQVIEWADRADLAQHAFDGQWRVLTEWKEFGLHMLMRYIKADDGLLDAQLAVVPVGTPPEDRPLLAPVYPTVEQGRSKIIRWLKDQSHLSFQEKIMGLLLKSGL